MQHPGEKFPALPKGVPTPQPVKTLYTVYIGKRQWQNIAATVSDPEDALIIEGFPQIDDKTGAISVFASNVTSKVRLARSKTAKAEKERQQNTNSADN
jgi:molybdopterin-guanine dinucleotide biosynthesis protein